MESLAPAYTSQVQPSWQQVWPMTMQDYADLSFFALYFSLFAGIAYIARIHFYIYFEYFKD